MADSLIDLGGGVKMVNPDSFLSKPVSGVEQFQNTLSTLNAVNQIKDYPIERAKKEADLKLAENDVYNIDVNNRKLRFEFESAKAEEKRNQVKFFGDTLTKAIEVYHVSPILGMSMMKEIAPNATFMDDENGSMHAFIPDENGKIQTFAIDAEKLPPEKRRDQEDKAKSQLESQQEFRDYAVVNQALKLGEKAVLKPTGPGDVSLVYGAITALDPRTGVKEGELSVVQNVSGISNLLLNKMKKLESGKLFGDEASQTRAELFEIIQRKNNALENTVKEMGRNNYRISKSRRLNPLSTVRPVGDLNVNSFMPLDELDKLPVNQLTPAQKLELYNSKTQEQP
jgi:hypothetical protein